jgi:hypothetical protein
MLPNVPGELTEEQKQQLKAAKDAIPELKQRIARAKQAGIDTADQETSLRSLEQQLNNLYNVYVRNTQ